MLKKVSKILLAITIINVTFYVFPPYFNSVSADTDFQVNVKEVLSVSITAPQGAVGDPDEFLVQTIGINVTSNTDRGFTAGMTTKTEDTSLKHTVKKDITIPTLGYTAMEWEFPSNSWGYSDYIDSEIFKPLVGSDFAPITLLSCYSVSTGYDPCPGSGTYTEVNFGAKANTDQSSGTYSGTVVISVVSGTNGSDLPAPTGSDPTPARPGQPEEEAQYDSESNTTVYTYTTDGITTTQISEGDNTSLYDGYTPPQGVTRSNSANIYGGSLVATILAISASIAAGSGVLFFILAKRKKDEDEE